MGVSDLIDTHAVAARRAVLVFRILIGVTLLVSGIIKALDNRHFLVTAMYSYGFPENLSPLLTLLAPLEVVLGLALLLGLYLRPVALGSALLLAAFSGGLVLAMRGGGLSDCGCFGPYVPMTPTVALVRNGVLLAGSLFVYLASRKGALHASTWQVLLLVVAATAAGGAGGWSAKDPIVSHSVVKLNQPFPMQGFTDGAPNFGKGETIVVFFLPTCPHCWNSVENVKRLLDAGDRPVIGVTMDDRKTIDTFLKDMNLRLPVYQVNRDFFFQAISALPVFVLVRDGVVIYKMDEMVPSIRTLEETIYPTLKPPEK
jgi:uncharacterized membrane protein YphA (DoxX/SURF4 family)